MIFTVILKWQIFCYIINKKYKFFVFAFRLSSLPPSPNPPAPACPLCKSLEPPYQPAPRDLHLWLTVTHSMPLKFWFWVIWNLQRPRLHPSTSVPLMISPPIPSWSHSPIVILSVQGSGHSHLKPCWSVWCQRPSVEKNIKYLTNNFLGLN